MPAENLPPSYCPDCDYGPMDCASNLFGRNAQPKPGDVSICANCGAFLEFDDELQLRTLPLAKLRALPKDQRALMHRTRRVLHQVKTEETR